MGQCTYLSYGGRINDLLCHGNLHSLSVQLGQAFHPASLRNQWCRNSIGVTTTGSIGGRDYEEGSDVEEDYEEADDAEPSSSSVAVLPLTGNEMVAEVGEHRDDNDDNDEPRGKGDYSKHPSCSPEEQECWALQPIHEPIMMCLTSPQHLCGPYIGYGIPVKKDLANRHICRHARCEYCVTYREMRGPSW